MIYSRRASNYPERIALSDPTYRMGMVDLLAINEETPRIDSGYSLEKEFIEFIYRNS